MSDLTKLTEAVQQGNLDLVRTILDGNKDLVYQEDETGATALHYATFNGDREIAQVLLDRGAPINRKDARFGATPAGWAIEYLRERGGFLAIELEDLAYAIELGDARWVARFLKRFPAFRKESDLKGKPFVQLARESGNREIANLFQSQDGAER
jgi:ankyrin repeat protein